MSNMLKVDYMQLALMAVSYFILNLDDIIEDKGRYVYDMEVSVEGAPLILTAEYSLIPLPKGKYPFSFDVVSCDVDLELYFGGCYNLACSYASDIVAEYMRRLKK